MTSSTASARSRTSATTRPPPTSACAACSPRPLASQSPAAWSSSTSTTQRSLRGLFYGIRRPITLVASGKVVHADARHHVTRHDTLARLLRVAPPVLDTIAVYGVRVLVPIARALQIPVLGRILASLEWWARDSFLRGFGAHLLVVLRKDEDADRAASNRK
jgi:hypothetical protein